MGEVVRDFRPGADDEQVAALWKRVFGVPRGGQTIEWLFRPGPGGESPRSVAEIDGRIVAHAGVAALRFRVAGENVLGAYSVGAMTDPAFQGRGLFFRIGTHLYERLEREGFAFVAGFSNERSARLMTGPLGRTPLRPFPWAVRVLSPLRVARALLRPSPASTGRRAALSDLVEGDVRVREVAATDAAVVPQLDAAWARAADDVPVGCVRDALFVAWRYATRPDARYRVLLAERAGQAAGFLTYRTMGLRGIQAAFVLDLVLPAGEATAGTLLLRAAERLARDEGAALLSALLPGSGAAREALRGARFLRIPERLHPQLIRFSVRGLGRFAGSKILENPQAWHLSWADTDVV